MVVRVKWHHSTLSRLDGVSHPCCSGNPPRKARAISAPGTQLSCILSLAHVWDSKLLILEEPTPLEYALSSGLESHRALTSTLCCTKAAVPRMPDAQILPVAPQKAATGVSSLCVLLRPCWWKALAGALVLGEEICRLQIVLQEGNPSLWAWPRRSLSHLEHLLGTRGPSSLQECTSWPRRLPPALEIPLPALGRISRVLQVIWARYSCVLETR